jgi:hypothetical protein
MSKVVVISVLVLAAVATADVFRSDARERTVTGPDEKGALAVKVHASAPPEFVAAGTTLRTRVLRRGHEYLSAEDIDAAFPAPLRGASFDIAHVASAGDGTVAVAVYAFPAGGPPLNSIQLWKDSRLLHAFTVPPGTFGGGLGFADDGHLVAALMPDGLTVILFSRDGRRLRSIPATSW